MGDFHRPQAIERAEAAPSSPGDDRRQFPRRSAHAAVRLAADGAEFQAELVNVSYGGMLVLLGDREVEIGRDVTSLLHHPQTGAEVSVPSRVVNRASCEDGRTAAGLQFQYSVDRIDEMMAFVDDLHRASLPAGPGELSGSLCDWPLEDVIAMLAYSSSQGTLRLRSGDEEGIVVHRDGEILHATTGLVTGMKAISRLLLWREGSFVYRTAIEPFEAAEEPLAIDAALLSGTVHRDESLRLGGGSKFDPDTTFRLDEVLMEQIAPELGEIYREIAEHVRMGFPLGAVLDILPQNDGVIYKALIELLEGGVITAE